MSDFFKQLIKTWVGDVSLTVDREKKMVAIKIGDETKTMTYDEAIDYAVKVFNE